MADHPSLTEKSRICTQRQQKKTWVAVIMSEIPSEFLVYVGISGGFGVPHTILSEVRKLRHRALNTPRTAFFI